MRLAQLATPGFQLAARFFELPARRGELPLRRAQQVAHASGFILEPRLLAFDLLDLIDLALRFVVEIRLLPAEQPENRFHTIQLALAPAQPRAQGEPVEDAGKLAEAWGEVIHGG